MPALFDNFKQHIVPLEGDTATNISGDVGGLTKYGISQESYPRLDIADLTYDEACAIYEHDFWIHYGLSRINSQLIANKLMSFLMNMNPFSAIQCVQRAVNRCGSDIPTDGILGINTINAINLAPQPWLLDRFRIEGALFYNYRVSVDKSQLKFLNGWIKRALS